MLFILLLILQIYYLVVSRPNLSGNGSGNQYSDYFIGESNWNSGFISQSHHSFTNKYSNYFVQTSYQMSNPQICFTTSALSKYSIIPNKYISVIGSYSVASTSHHYSLSNTPNQYISIVGSVSVTQYSVSLLVMSSSKLLPTFGPTFGPTSSTTLEPTPTTTFMPTSSTTLEPTPTTTFMPIPESNPTITFLTTATLSGFPTASLSIPEQTAYIIAFSTSINIDSQMVEIVNQQLANRRLTHNIDITTQITYPYVLDPQSTYTMLANKIQTNIGVGSNFTKLLIAVSKQMGITSYNNVSVIGVHVSPLLNDDGGKGKVEPPYKIGTILLVIMILPAVTVALIFVVYLYKKHYRRRYHFIENPLYSRV